MICEFCDKDKTDYKNLHWKCVQIPPDSKPCSCWCTNRMTFKENFKQ